VRIQHGHGFGEIGGHLVMVSDNHIHPQAFRQPHFLVASDATIHGDQDARAPCHQLAYGTGVEPVAFAQAMRQVVRHGHAEVAEEPTQHRGRGDAIHIVIAIDGDRFLGIESMGQALDRLRHPSHAEGVMQALEGRIEELVGAFDGGDAAVDQQLGAQHPSL